MADMSNIAALLARGNSGGGQQRSYLDSPMYQQMLAQTLAQGQPQSEYPGQAIANTASQLINAYMLKQSMQQAQQKQQAGNQSLADALLPGQDVPGMAASTQLPWATSEAPAPAVPGGVAPRPIGIFGPQVDVSTPGFKVDDPNNAGLVAALNGGAIDAQSLAPALMQKFGLGAPKAPVKGSPGDVFFDPVTHQPIPGMAAPFKPDAPQKPEVPTTREFTVGNKTITKQWNPASGNWDEIATADRYKPTTIINGPKDPVGYRATADGNLAYIPGGPADPTKGAGKKAPTEDQAKNMQLYQRASQQLKILVGDGKNDTGTFDALATTGDQLGAGLADHIPFGLLPKAMVTGGQYQRASGALKDIAASYLYSVSGATANPGEVATLSETVTPKMGDSAQTIADKKARIQQMVESIHTRAGGAEIGGGAPAKPNTIHFEDLP